MNQRMRRNKNTVTATPPPKSPAQNASWRKLSNRIAVTETQINSGNLSPQEETQLKVRLERDRRTLAEINETLQAAQAAAGSDPRELALVQKAAELKAREEAIVAKEHELIAREANLEMAEGRMAEIAAGAAEAFPNPAPRSEAELTALAGGVPQPTTDDLL